MGLTGITRLARLALGLVMTWPVAAHANEPVVYEPGYFEQFAPQTAADMVSRIPGFTIRGGEGGERGFGQASLNILINGRRPSTKSLGANDILSRIPYDSVVRIEVVDGTSLDIPGLTGDVANIVQESFGISGQWETAVRLEEGTEPQWPDASGSLSVTRGDVSVTLAASAGQFTYTEVGEELFFNADGLLAEDRVEDVVFENQRPSLNGELSWTPASGNILNINAEVQTENENIDVRETFAAVGEGGTDGQSLLFVGEDGFEYEFGADYAFDAGPGRLKVIGLYGVETEDEITRVSDFTQGRAPTFQEFLQDSRESEIIGRAEYTLGDGAWQLAAEYAFNELEAESEFNGAALPTVEVNEDRIQGSMSHNRRLGAWDVQGNIGVEYSEIEVPSLPSSGAREFYRPKGTLSASRDLDSKHTLVLQAERSVGQLDFFDFVSELDLEDGRDDRGNTRIVPNQQWTFEGTVERTDPAWLSWRFTPRLGIIDDPIDRIRFADGTEGPGNLDSRAYFYGAEGNFTLVMDRVVKGMRLEGNGSLFETDIEDPLTGDRRRFNGGALWNYELELRHDIRDTPWAYQVNFGDTQDPVRAFRFDEVLSQLRRDPRFTTRIEHKAFFGMNLQLILQNVLNQETLRTRDIFDGDRFGPFLRREERLRSRGARFSIVLSDTF